MKRLFIPILTAVLFGAFSLQAADTDVTSMTNTIYVQKASAVPGATVQLSVQMKNATAATVSGYQFSLALPTGASYVASSAKTSTARTSSASNFTLDVRGTSKLGFMCYSVSSATFSGTSGEVATFQINAPATAGDYTLATTGASLSLQNGSDVACENVNMTLHVHGLTATAAKAATCTTDGNNAYWTCSKCNKVFSDANGTTETTVAAQTVPATGHTYSSTPVWTWSEDGQSASAAFSCVNNDDTQTETAAVTSAVKTAATCTEKGTTTYTAKVTFEGKEYTATKDVVDIDAIGHSYVSNPIWTWASDYTSASATVRCSIDDSHQLTVTDEEIEVVDNNDGTFTYYATVILNDREESDSKTVRLYDVCDLNRDGDITVIDIVTWVNKQDNGEDVGVAVEDIVSKILNKMPDINAINSKHEKVFYTEDNESLKSELLY